MTPAATTPTTPPRRARGTIWLAVLTASAVVAIVCSGLVLSAAVAEAPPPAAVAAPAGASATPPAAIVRIVFKVLGVGKAPAPPQATVNWGKKRLGIVKPKAPFTVERPRDSGPLDVVVRAPGYVSVHTRAYTFTDSTVAVRLTASDKKNTIYGYKEVLPPETDGGVEGSGSPDGGAPP